MGKKKPKEKKPQNGLDKDKLKDLRRDIRTATTIAGEKAVAEALGFETTTDAQTAVNAGMLKRDFGTMSNAVKRIVKPTQTKVNKYADHGRT